MAKKELSYLEECNIADEKRPINVLLEDKFFKRWAKPPKILRRIAPDTTWLSNGKMMSKYSDVQLRKLVEAGVLEAIPGGWRYKGVG